MLKENKVLVTDHDFELAIFYVCSVDVTQNNEIIESGCKITTYTKDVIVVGGGKYIRALCQFK